MGCTSTKYTPYVERHLSIADNNHYNHYDLLFFSKSAKKNQWDSVGIIIDLPSVYPRTDGVLLFEFTPNNPTLLQDFLTLKQIQSGVHLVSLAAKLMERHTKIGVRRFKNLNGEFTDHESVDCFDQIVKCAGLRSSTYPAHAHNIVNAQYEHSAQLVCEFLKRQHILAPTQNSRAVQIKSFLKKNFASGCYGPLDVVLKTTQ